MGGRAEGRLLLMARARTTDGSRGVGLSIVVNNGWLFLDHTAEDSRKVMAGSLTM